MQEPDRETSTSNSHTSAIQSWSGVLKNLKELSSATIKENVDLTKRVKLLEEELQVWKKAYSTENASAENAKQQYENEKTKLSKRVILLETMHESMVLCVLDGDGNIFADRLLVAGLEGGREVAKTLTTGIWDYLKIHGYQANTHCTFWLSIYFNRRGLQKTLIRSGVCTADQFEGFLVGISQASPRFLLIDVGYGKEAADAKIKEYLQTYTRFPQTLKVFFGGGHDNGYLPTLTALENEGALDKVVLLTGYREIAAELRGLNMSTLSLDNLFRGTKLPFSPAGRFGGPGPPSTPASTASDIAMFPPSSSRSPTAVTNISSTSAETNDYAPRQKIDPNMPLSNLRPHPCNNFYLLGKCNNLNSCRYGHDYELSTEHINQLRIIVKRIPCKSILKGQQCNYGSNCIMGHTCPNGPQCKFFKDRKCRFGNADAHTTKESDGDSVISPVVQSMQNSNPTEHSLLAALDAWNFTIG